MNGPSTHAPPSLEPRLAELRPGLEMLGLPACVLDAQLRYRFLNSAYVAHAGRPASDFLGRMPDEVFAKRPEDSRRDYMMRALAGETAIFNRQTIEGPHTGLWVRAHYLPLRDGEHVLGVLVVLVDVQQLKDAEAALDDQRKQLQLVIDNIGVPMSYIDRDWRFRFANQPGVDWQVASPGEAIGKRVDELFDAETMALIRPQVEAALRGEKRTYERQARMQSGAMRWVRVMLVPDFGADGTVHGLYTLMLDVDKDHRLREAIERQEAQLRYFAENIPGPIAVVDAGFRYVFANKMFQEIRGLGLDELVGRPVREVLGAEASREYFEPFVERLTRGETCTYERLVASAGREPRWHLVKLAPILGPGGEFNGYYIVGSDIHDIKLAQERARAQDAQLRLYTDNIPDAVAYLNAERRILFANKHFAAQRKTTPEAIIGRTTAELMGGDTATWIAERTQTVFDRGEVATYEREMKLDDGTRRWLHVKAVPDMSASGVVRGMYVVAHDITEVKDAQERLAVREEEMRFFAENIPEAIVFVDLERGCTFVNNVFLATRGLTREFALGKMPAEVYPPAVMEELQPHLDAAISGRESTYERELTLPTGAKRWVRVRITPRRGPAGRVIGYYVVSTDIHELKMVEEKLRHTNSTLSAHFDNTPLAVIECDTQQRVVRWSGQAETIFGWSAAETLGRTLASLRHVYEEDESAVAEMTRGLVEGGMRHGTLLHRNYRKDGSVIWVEWHNSSLRDASGRVISILSLAQDVSSRIQAEERLQFMATHDGLTALPNSVLLNDRLEQALARARRARTRVGVMFLDLDHFKDVNDTLGHRVGDALLKELARRIRASLRQSDLLARISGDEFVVVLEDVTDDYAPEHVARKILDEVRRPFQLEGNEIHVSCSLGLALHPEDGTDADTLLKNADAAMYHAKELGRNGFRSFSAELGQRRMHRLQVETALRRALRDGELSLHYQPIMDLVTGGVRRAEALLRWHDPERGLVLPQAFVPLAEESGLGHALGGWVLDTACRQARRWRDAGLGDITVCVNLSASQLRDSGMVADLKKTLERHGCEPGWLQFEITETSMVRDLEGASAVLARLRTLGVRIAIDDFGTGFSSLSHLRHLPVDVLKVDKGFVADIDTVPRGAGRDVAGGAAIVSAVIGLARGLGLDVVAEGVEKQSQMDFLLREGCGAGQGYLICPPLPAAEFERWLRARIAPPAARKRLPTKKRRDAKTTS
jgi:diguanylate cyclase (GGDEF)-like protein/PAS domain S-box-containing protein